MNRIIIVCALVMAGAAGYAAASRQPSLAPMAVPADTTPAYVTAPGYVEPVSEEIDIGSELPGRIDRVLVEEGARVSAGQVVAMLANADYVARVDSARAMLAQREAERLRIVNGARTEEKREALAGVEEADVVLADAVLERDRRRRLLDAGAVSVEEASRAERAWLVAEARRRAAGERYALVQDATRAEDRARADAAVAVARGDVEQAEAMLAKTYIKSPIDGVVLRRALPVGREHPAGDAHPGAHRRRRLAAPRARRDRRAGRGAGARRPARLRHRRRVRRQEVHGAGDAGRRVAREEGRPHRGPVGAGRHEGAGSADRSRRRRRSCVRACGWMCSWMPMRGGGRRRRDPNSRNSRRRIRRIKEQETPEAPSTPECPRPCVRDAGGCAPGCRCPAWDV